MPARAQVERIRLRRELTLDSEAVSGDRGNGQCKRGRRIQVSQGARLAWMSAIPGDPGPA